MKIFFSVVFMFTFLSLFAQNKILSGIITSENNVVEFATIILSNGQTTTSNNKGFYEFSNLIEGKYQVTVTGIAFQTIKKEIIISNESVHTLNFDVTNFQNKLQEVVVTGTRTFKRKTNSPIVVNVLDSKTLQNLQVCNLSEGLKFQPGLRVETDCQTCNYQQLRMNGLAGSYSQILINGRPIFSPMMGLYGMEQLPVNMIDRIEVVRGGGSSIYGSSAIGGTVNVITKIPNRDAFEINSTYHNLDGKTDDYQLNGNATFVSENRDAGISLFMSRRERDFFDANNDNFSEIPKIENTSLGTNLFFKPVENQKIEFSLSNINEYRFGGEMVEKPAYLTQQSEERKHKIWMSSIDYQINFKDGKSSLITYGGWQNTNRTHYTGIFPDQADEIQNHLENPPYGISQAQTLQAGMQFNYRVESFLKGSNIFTFGSEYVSDKITDEIKSYQYFINQHTKNLGSFLQSDWEIIPNLNLLSGIRIDVHNLMSQAILSPRFALMYKHKENTQFRLSYGTGFRAPQAFDTDLHIAFAGGGVSRVIYDPNLKEERSQSWSASVNYDRATEKFIAGFTFEGFYTHLNDAFVLENIGTDAFGEIFEKTNGSSATVKGITLELRANYNRKMQLETGFTFQTAQFAQPVQYLENTAPTKDFLRTPKQYGFANLTMNFSERLKMNLNYVFTGSMEVAHFAGAINQPTDEFIKTKSFSEVNSKIVYTIPSKKFDMNFEIYGGLKNIFNQYQSDFDSGKNRDSNYVYGPALPRTIFFGLKISSE
ncbi:TonB-dependent receptor [Flavobacterium sp.]|uniref:TonB-dependent receptor n=1 Tax=Flavobacterium sp. TaxID=239 RepID=UPI002622256D|nr:TonB-dependent receptor [Flavobacterium sp.]MDD3003730.1 TonB-dependent receptor [Flavobacterium sp.]